MVICRFGFWAEARGKGDVLLSILGNPLIYRAYVSAILSSASWALVD